MTWDCKAIPGLLYIDRFIHTAYVFSINPFRCQFFAIILSIITTLLLLVLRAKMSILLDKTAIIAAILIGGGALVGCSTITPQQQLQIDKSRCQDIGFANRSVPMAECVQRYELDRRADRRARQAALDRMVERPTWVDWPHHRTSYGYRHRSW